MAEEAYAPGRPAQPSQRDATGRHRVSPGPEPATTEAKRREPAGADRRAGHRWYVWLIPVFALGVGALLLASLPLVPGPTRPPPADAEVPPAVGVAAASVPPEQAAVPTATASPSGGAGSPSATPSGSPSPAGPTATPAAPLTPTIGAGSAAPPPPAPPAPPPQPVLLGPSDNGGLADLVDRYCDQHVGGSWAGTRGDGRWECRRLLLSSRIVDMDVACRDRYGSDAFAQTSNTRDPYAWRCFRN